MRLLALAVLLSAPAFAAPQAAVRDKLASLDAQYTQHSNLHAVAQQALGSRTALSNKYGKLASERWRPGHNGTKSLSVKLDGLATESSAEMYKHAGAMQVIEAERQVLRDELAGKKAPKPSAKALAAEHEAKVSAVRTQVAAAKTSHAELSAKLTSLDGQYVSWKGLYDLKTTEQTRAEQHRDAAAGVGLSFWKRTFTSSPAKARAFQSLADTEAQEAMGYKSRYEGIDRQRSSTRYAIEVSKKNVGELEKKLAELDQ